MSDPFDLILVDGTDPVKGDFRDYFHERLPLILTSAAEITSLDLSTDTYVVMIQDRSSIFVYDSGDTTTAHDGLKTLVDNGGRRYKIITEQHTFSLPASNAPGGLVARTTSGPGAATQELATNDIMVVGLDFDKDTNEYAQATIQMPKSWDQGTFICQFIWKNAATVGSGDVIWAAQALALRDGDDMDTAFGTNKPVTDTFVATDDLHISVETAAMTASGTVGSECVVVFQIYRKASAGGDTYDQDARLIAIKIHYTTAADSDD